MSRFDDALNETESLKGHVEFAIFIALDFPGGFVRAHNAVGTKSFGGNDYLGVGGFGKIDVVPEGVDVRTSPLRMELSGVDNDLLTDVLAQDYRGRAATVYTGYFDANGGLVADPEIEWVGVMDTVTITLGRNTGRVMVTAENRLYYLLNRRNERRYTNEDQIERNSGDLFFDQLASSHDMVIKWGGHTITNTDGRLRPNPNVSNPK